MPGCDIFAFSLKHLPFRALARTAVSPVFLVARCPHAHIRSSTSRSPGCARARARARSLPVAPCEHPRKYIRAESVLFVFINVHPTPIVRCAAMYLGRPPPDGGCQALRSVGVTAAAMDLSRPFQRPKYRFHHSTAPSFLPFFTTAAAVLSTHAHHTRRTPPTPILQAILTGFGVGRYRKPGPWAARRAERVGVLFDHLLSLVHDPSAQGSRPRTTNPMA